MPSGLSIAYIEQRIDRTTQSNNAPLNMDYMFIPSRDFCLFSNSAAPTDSQAVKRMGYNLSPRMEPVQSL